MTCLEKRIDTLEAENRWLKWGAAAALLFSILSPFFTLAILSGISKTGQDQQVVHKVIEAEEFTLRDKAGKRRAVLAMTQYGGPALQLGDENEQPAVRLALTKDGAGLHLRRNERWAALGVDEDHPCLLFGENDQAAMQLSTSYTSSQLTFRDVNGANRVSMSLTQGESSSGGGLLFMDEKGDISSKSLASLTETTQKTKARSR